MLSRGYDAPRDRLLPFILALGLTAIGVAGAVARQPAMKWPDGNRAAMVLTYDDALRSHLDVALPQLDSAGFKGNQATLPARRLLRHTRLESHPRMDAALKLHRPCLVHFFPVRRARRHEVVRIQRLTFGRDDRRV
jgi:hypothetical protein